MSDSIGAPTDAVFRANKRRKIYRKRNVDDEDDGVSLPTEGASDVGSEAQQRTQTVKRPVAKKYGIGFSTAGSKALPEETTPTVTAMVPFQGPELDDDQAANDRFVKPAGKTAVVEDKHLYVFPGVERNAQGAVLTA